LRHAELIRLAFSRRHYFSLADYAHTPLFRHDAA
jgi:hypothetical protein